MGAESFPINETDDSDKTVLSSSSLGDDDEITVGAADGLIVDRPVVDGAP